MTYADKLRDPRWQKKRLQILKRDKWKCKLCKDDTTELHVHHIEYTGEPWDSPNENLITLCAHCHHEIEADKIDLSTGKVKAYKSAQWDGGSRIMFTKVDGRVTFNIYDNSGNFTVGFSLDEETRKEIKRFLNG